MAEYPDAVVIQTHRDPLKVITSISALVAHLRSMASDHSSVARAAAQYSDDIFVGLERSLAARSDGTLPAGQFDRRPVRRVHGRPLRHHRAVYDQLGVELTAEAERRMRDFLATHPGDGGGGGTRYSWADTGLDEAALRKRRRPLSGVLRGRPPRRWPDPPEG